MNQLLIQISARPWLRWSLWVLYAVLFYNAGLATTTWLLEPDAFAGGWQWLWVAAFPVLLSGFFKLNRHLGCAGDSCAPRGSAPTGYKAPPGH
jgi:hypothetical protein